MRPKVDRFEAIALGQLQRDARQFLGDLFPKLRVGLEIAQVEGAHTVIARIPEDTAPYPQEDVDYTLSELGLGRTAVQKPQDI